MTAVSLQAQYPIVYGNVESIEDAQVVLLLEEHDSRDNFKKIEEIINLYYQASQDLIMLELSWKMSRDELLLREQSRGEHRYQLLKDKNIVGWDHEERDEWISKFYQNKDVLDFQEAIECIKQLSKSTNIASLNQSFATLVRGVRCLTKNQTLLPLSEYEDFIKNRDFSAPQFDQLRKELLSTGTEILTRLKNAFIRKSFPLRQDSLIERLKAQLEQPASKKGRIFVIMGKNHGSFSDYSSYNDEVKKLFNYLNNKFTFISV